MSNPEVVYVLIITHNIINGAIGGAIFGAIAGIVVSWVTGIENRFNQSTIVVSLLTCIISVVFFTAGGILVGVAFDHYGFKLLR